MYSSRRLYRGADKSLVRPGSEQVRKHIRDARDFNNIKFFGFLFFPQGNAPNEIHVILTETLAYFLPGRAKDLSAPPVSSFYIEVRRGLLNCLYAQR